MSFMQHARIAFTRNLVVNGKWGSSFWFRSVVPKVGGTARLGTVRNSRGSVKQTWAFGGVRRPS